MTHIQTEIVNIINSHHTIPAVDDDNSVSSSDASVVEYNYEARVFYTNNNTTTMINYFRIKDPCNFDYFKSHLGWEQKNGTGNYVPVKYGTGGNIDNTDNADNDFIYINGSKDVKDNGASESLGTLSSTIAFDESKIDSSVNVNGVDENKIQDLGLKLENGNISTKKFFSVVTPKSGANNLTKICGFHTAENANDLKIQFFDTTAGNYILKYKEQTSDDESTSASTDNMTLILCQIPNNEGGGKRKKKTPSARSKKRSKTSQTKTLKKH